MIINLAPNPQVLSNKVAKYFTQMGGAGLGLTTSLFQSKLNILADDIQLMKYCFCVCLFECVYSSDLPPDCGKLANFF